METSGSRGLDPCLAVVPARGGSKGLPGKNVRLLAGLPLIVHSLRCAWLVPRLARVIVSTDSEEIAAVARAAGAEVPFLRPAELATDESPLVPVLAHALAEVERSLAIRFASVLLLDPTSPFRIPSDIERAFDLLGADLRADGVVACSQPTFNPFFDGVVEREGGLASAFGGRAAFTRRQDAPRFLRITGTLYLWRAGLVRRSPRLWLDEGRHLALEIPEARAFSIDDGFQLELAGLFIERGLVRLPWLEGGR